MGTAYIERKRTLDIDEKKLVMGLEHKNIPIVYFSPKQLIRDKIKIVNPFIVSGSISSVLKSLELLQIKKPLSNSYPKAIDGFYHRHLWESTLDIAISDYNRGVDYFIKPRYDFKSFTGITLQGNNPMISLSSLINKFGKRYPILCSEIIQIQSEHRVYVVYGEVLDIVHYYGDEFTFADTETIKEVVKKIFNSTENLAGYALDFAVTKQGKTVVLEMNEGFSIDSYSSSSDTYLRTLKARWDELTSK